MTEEEKEAIKWLNNFKDIIEQSLVLFDEKLTVKCGIETFNKFNTLLKLINKINEQE